VIGICHRLGLSTKGFFIVGHPKESPNTIDETVDFARRLKLDHVVVTVNTPMPGTDQHRRAGEYGTLDESSWSRFNYWHPVFVPHGMHREFIRRFYLRPRLLLRHARKLATDPNTIVQLWNLAKDLSRLITDRARLRAMATGSSKRS